MKNRLPYLVCTLLLALGAYPAAAQVAGFAEITSPGDGEALEGWVTVTGTADHPQFSGYELAFAYDPNPTGSWFPLTERIEAPVHDDRLALWDTTQITPGAYQLRLSVFTREGGTLTATVAGLDIGVPARASESAPAGPVGPAESVGAYSPGAPPAGEAPPAPPSPDSTLLRILIYGAGLATTALGALGLYTLLRPRVRGYVGLLQSRRLRQEQRRRRRSGR